MMKSFSSLVLAGVALGALGMGTSVFAADVDTATMSGNAQIEFTKPTPANPDHPDNPTNPDLQLLSVPNFDFGSHEMTADGTATATGTKNFKVYDMRANGADKQSKWTLSAQLDAAGLKNGNSKLALKTMTMTTENGDTGYVAGDSNTDLIAGGEVANQAKYFASTQQSGKVTSEMTYDNSALANGTYSGTINYTLSADKGI